MTFDSLKERDRYIELELMQKAGLIRNLLTQQAFVLAESVVLDGRKKPALRYVADFTYFDANEFVVEDVKGVKTKEYRIKRHLMKSVLGIEVKEV